MDDGRRPRDRHDFAPVKRKSDERLIMMNGKDASR